MSPLNHMLLTIGFCTIVWWCIGAIEKFNSYTKMWEFNKREYINEHQEKETDRD